MTTMFKIFTLAALTGYSAALQQNTIEWAGVYHTSADHATQLNPSLDAAETSIGTLRTSVTTLDTECEARDSEIATLLGLVDIITEQAGAAQEPIMLIPGKISFINSRLDEIEDKVEAASGADPAGTIAVEIAALSTAMAAVATLYAPAASQLTRVTTLEEQFFAIKALASRIEAIEATLAKAQTEITANETALTAITTQLDAEPFSGYATAWTAAITNIGQQTLPAKAVYFKSEPKQEFVDAAGFIAIAEFCVTTGDKLEFYMNAALTTASLPHTVAAFQLSEYGAADNFLSVRAEYVLPTQATEELTATLYTLFTVENASTVKLILEYSTDDTNVTDNTFSEENGFQWAYKFFDQDYVIASTPAACP